jgi:hypothetical protein
LNTRVVTADLSKLTTIVITQAQHLALADAQGDTVLSPGDYEIFFHEGNPEQVQAPLRVSLRLSGVDTVVEPSPL